MTMPRFLLIASTVLIGAAWATFSRSAAPSDNTLETTALKTTALETTAPKTTAQNRSAMNSATNQVADLEWTLVKQAGSLLLEYRITNRSKARFYLSDQLPVSGAKGWVVADKAVIVSNDAQANTVLFSRGRVASVTPLPFLVDPGARAIDPNQTLTGSALVKLPIAAWHYRGQTAAIQSSPQWAILEIGYLTSAYWEELPLATGGKLTISQPSDPMLVLRFDRKAIPK